MEKFLVNIVKYYYWYLVAIAASLMFGFRDVSFVLILVVVGTVLVSYSSIRWKWFDGVVFVYLLYSLVSYFFVEYAYSFRLYYLGIRAQIIPLLFYFIARSKHFKTDAFFENFRQPLFFAMLCGVYFYFFQPYFYVSYKADVIWNNFDSDVNDLSGKLLYEFTRMSSFWPHSYFIGYSSLFLFMYAAKKIVVDNCYRKFDLACFALSFFCLFFAQQRVSIAFGVLFLVALTFYATMKKLPARNLLYMLWGGTIVFGIGIFFIVMNYLDVDFIEYILNRSVNYEGSLVGDRFALFDTFFKDISFFGSGLSCGLKIFKYAFFEFCTLCFCLVAMIGAAVWELGTLQPFLYWFCIGHIQSKFDRRDELQAEYETYFEKLRRQDDEDAVEEDE